MDQQYFFDFLPFPLGTVLILIVIPFGPLLFLFDLWSVRSSCFHGETPRGLLSDIRMYSGLVLMTISLFLINRPFHFLPNILFQLPAIGVFLIVWGFFLLLVGVRSLLIRRWIRLGRARSSEERPRPDDQ
jgi:hypothetical protein